ncbi:Glycoside hydrolase, family 28 [Dillenia turbinata]|uniref:Glycoside hydrolase, family 28 n=1 Tax=Dillenia turbinata TaxID=194707 RepID=A0AAN8YUH8_9MAGN
MEKFNFKSITYMILVALLVLSTSFGICDARKGKHLERSRGTHHHHHPRPGGAKEILFSPPSDGYGASLEENSLVATQSSSKSSTIFNVLAYGAKGDGKTDDTTAFEATWAAACKVAASTMLIPSGSVFLVKPISFSGPNCGPNMVFQLDGKIIAPTSSGAWGNGVLEWINFTKLKGITITGKGVIDGQGPAWWGDSTTYDPTEVYENESDSSNSSDPVYTEQSGKMPSTKPTALRFYGSTDVTVTGVTIQNSPQTHLKFDYCTAVQVYDMSISSPGDSPNTDGIHLQGSQDVVIRGTHLACGDDCVSIQTGSSNVYIHSVNCGPGHGISIGALGKDNTKACVSNVTVRDVAIQSTLAGVRIKTWQGGSGLVQGVMFSNVQVTDVQTPIVIDQFYCGGSKCKNSSSAVAINGVTYENIKGTYTASPVHFACSDNLPCTGLTLNTIQLTPSEKSSDPFCWEAYGQLLTDTEPPIDCIASGHPSGSGGGNYNSC